MENDVVMQYVGSSITSEASSISLDQRLPAADMIGSGATQAHTAPWHTRDLQAEHAQAPSAGADGGKAAHEALQEELKAAHAEKEALQQEVYALLGAHVRAEHASKLYVRAVALLSKSQQQLEQQAKASQEAKLTRESARLGRMVVSRTPDGRTLEEWQHGYAIISHYLSKHGYAIISHFLSMRSAPTVSFQATLER